MTSQASEPEYDLSTQSVQREEEKELNLYFILIEIINATDLIKADIGIGSSSDPFVEVTANGQTFTTKTIMNNLNPEFNEKTSFCFFQHVKELLFKVWDFDKNSKHDEIGEKALDISNFFQPDHQGFKGVLKLEKVKSGNLQVSVKGRLVRPIELENRCVEMLKLKNENQKKIEEKQQEIEKLTKETQNLDEIQNKLKEEQATLELTVTQFEEAKQDLQTSIQNLKNKISQTQTDIQNLKAQIQGAKDEIVNIEKETTEQESQCNSKKTQKENILEEMESIRRKLRE